MATKPETTLIGALAKALPEIGAVAKNKDNPAFKAGGKVSKYADLAAIIDALEPIKAHGLWYRQVSLQSAEGAMIETFYIHESGEELSAGVTFMPASNRNAQSFGSALTYCRRYGLQAAFGLATEDDDGNEASRPNPANERGGYRHEPQSYTDDPVDFITDEQAEWLINMLDQHNIQPARLLKAAGARTITSIPAAKYDNARTWIAKAIEAKEVA